MDQLKEAAATEQTNLKSLQALQQIELNKQKHAYSKKELPDSLVIKSNQKLIGGIPKTIFKAPITEHIFSGLKNLDNNKSKKN